MSESNEATAESSVGTAESSVGKAKRLRALELILVLFVAFAPPLFNSFNLVYTGERTYEPGHLREMYIAGFIYETAAIAVLSYVLFRQGRGLRALGFAFSWLDLPVSLLLFLLAYAVSYLCVYATYYGYYLAAGKVLNTAPQNVGFLQAGLTAWPIIFVLFNPFYEELIVRAYAISEVSYLTGSSVLAVIFSVIMQAAYHLYQGAFSVWVYAWMFLVFSLYYVRRRRIMPVILAHLYFDLLALITYAVRH